ncbi:MAG: hypothetical protein ABMA64_29045 [Myxococcota bacterium]
MRTVRWLWVLLPLVWLGLACGGLVGEEAVPEERPLESPFTWGLLMSWCALLIGGGSAVLGIWIDRDKSRPASFAVALSGLIMAAMGVGAMQGYLDEEGAIENRANLERMLDMVEELSEKSGDPALAALMETEGKHRRPRARRAPAPPAPIEPAAVEPAAVEPAPEEGAADEGAAPVEPAAAEGAAPVEPTPDAPAPAAAPAAPAPAPAAAPSGGDKTGKAKAGKAKNGGGE